MEKNRVTKEQLDSILLSENKTIIVDFYADWCGPCRSLTPTLEQIESENSDSVRLIKVNVDESPELTSFFGVRGIPSLIFFKNGQAVKSLVGNQEKNELEKIIKQI